MKTEKKSIRLDPQGVDDAAGAIQEWLTAAGAKRRDMLRIRLTMEEMLAKICENGAEGLRGELRFTRFLGAGHLTLRYGGERYDPTRTAEDGMEELSAEILARTGFLPTWRRRGDENELRLRFPLPGLRPEYLMLICIAAAAAVGFAGTWIPAAVRAGVTDFCLRFLADGFLDLLNTFIGLMIFLAIVTGICGIGSVSGFGRVGRLTISRFVGNSFLLAVPVVLAGRLLFSTGRAGRRAAPRSCPSWRCSSASSPETPSGPSWRGTTCRSSFWACWWGWASCWSGTRPTASGGSRARPRAW